MRNILIMTTFCSLFYLTTFAQDRAKLDFTFKMNNYIDQKISDPVYMIKATEIYGHTCDKHHIVTEEEIKARAAEAEKHAYIQSNMEEYMRLYFPETSTRTVTADPFICDNGGFEQGFLYYTGYSSTFNGGSLSCTPTLDGYPSVFIPSVMPSFREFEIVSPGFDVTTGLQKVKFGNKALKLNDPFNHIQGGAYIHCRGDYSIDRLVKQFEVTAENIEFTIWYALALENPTNHIDNQPFFSIKCDLAPNSDLCFDAEILKCEQTYTQSGCVPELMDVLDWTCHRIKIPQSEIGNIATLEITMADCGQGGHNGYVFLDGICEECAGSSLGSGLLSDQNFNGKIGIKHSPCNNGNALICGSFTWPTLCNDNWTLDSISIQGMTYSNLAIDTMSQTFCFEISALDFGENSCVSLYADLFFSSNQNNLPSQQSNSIVLCKNWFLPNEFEVDVLECNSNYTASLLSDDYYYITVDILDPTYNGWTIQRQLYDPYDGESGLYNIKTGTGNAGLILGPFLIQEGCWDILINLPNCAYKEKICPPPFCSGCDAFAGLEISNVTCIPSITLGGLDSWSFDIFVPGNGTYSIGGVPKSKGVNYTISMGQIGHNCVEFELLDFQTSCKQSLIVCPPVPCSVRDCDIDVNLGKITCTNNGYTVELHSNNSNLCYKLSGGVNTPVPVVGGIGPFTGDVQVEISLCNNPACFKMIYIPKPDCSDPNIELSQGRTVGSSVSGDLYVVPNPIINDQLIIKSDLDIKKEIEYRIYSISGQLILTGKFEGSESTIQFSYKNGIYILSYSNDDGSVKTSRFIK